MRLIEILVDVMGRAFSSLNPALLRGMVHPGSEDPGNWAPTALAVIYTDRPGAPPSPYDPQHGPDAERKWEQVEAQLNAAGHSVNIVPVNAAVMAVFNKS